MRNQYPMLSPWIEDIMSKATEHFKNDPYVKDYYQKAQENEQIMNGTRDAGQDASAMQAPQVDPNAAPTQLLMISLNLLFRRIRLREVMASVINL